MEILLFFEGIVYINHSVPEGHFFFSGVLSFKYVYILKEHRSGGVRNHETYLSHTCYKSNGETFMHIHTHTHIYVYIYIVLYFYNLIETVLESKM